MELAKSLSWNGPAKRVGLLSSNEGNASVFVARRVGRSTTTLKRQRASSSFPEIPCNHALGESNFTSVKGPGTGAHKRHRIKQGELHAQDDLLANARAFVRSAEVLGLGRRTPVFKCGA